ncbi:MAG TPA: hypothetical protein PKK15_03060 [Kouleothrix sp.]|uniref:hypothetical protein n=1 Tax=Kouleothrix sp. TaxID=2779161 RepID=UPI002C0C2E46|nr:hypothetical protein [Kouleothrix sp.]
MEQLTPFRVTLPASLPASDRETLIASLQTVATVQIAEKKDPTIDAIFAVVKQAGDAADAIINIVTLAGMIYGWARALHKRGIIPDVTLFRPDQPELNLSRVQSTQEIEAWLRHMTR